MAQLGARLDGIEEVVGSNPIGSTKFKKKIPTSSGTICDATRRHLYKSNSLRPHFDESGRTVYDPYR